MLIPTTPHEVLIFLLPFTNEIANLFKSTFDLPNWVYNSIPRTNDEIISKLMLDAVSLYGVILNILEAASKNFNVVSLSTLSLILILFSFIIPTYSIPLLAESSIKNKSIYILGLIILFALIDRAALLATQSFNHAISHNEKQEHTKSKRVYFIILGMVSIVAASYSSKIESKLGIFMPLLIGLAVYVVGTIIIENTFDSNESIQKEDAHQMSMI